MPKQATPGSQSLNAPPLRPFENDTVPKLFFHAVDRHAGGRGMMFENDAGWQSLTRAEVFAEVRRVAAGLEEMGIEPGDRVGIMSENRPEWAIADFAVLGLGAADVPVYPTLPPNQIAYILNDAGAKAIFVSDREQLAKIQEVRDQLPALREVIVFDEPGTAPPGVRTLAELKLAGDRRIEAGEASNFRARAMEVAPDALATLIYTSGTTGDPKGVMLTHHNLASNVAATHQHDVLVFSAGEIALSFLPLSHAFERMVDYYYWQGGATIAYVSKVEALPSAMLEVRPHVIAAAPRVFEKIYTRVMGATGIRKLLVSWAKKVGEAAVEDRLAGRGPATLQERLADRLVFSKLRARTGGRVKLFVSGSAPLSPDIARFFWAAGLPVYEGYGLTETSPVLTVNKPGAVKLGTVGPPLPGTELAITGAGEVLARGPQIMKGYWNRPEAVAEIIDGDGWLHTGDIGVIDEGGFLRITDRLKNILVTAGGKNIAPAPIENLVVMSPYVAQVVMLGDRRPFPSLLIVPDLENLRGWAASQGIDATDPRALVEDPRVHAFLEQEALGRLQHLARYEMPKKIAVVADEFSVASGELTPSLKVKRRVVEERYGDLIEALYA
jgi:long-chain acyl-CoA synthetase